MHYVNHSRTIRVRINLALFHFSHPFLKHYTSLNHALGHMDVYYIPEAWCMYINAKHCMVHAYLITFLKSESR